MKLKDFHCTWLYLSIVHLLCLASVNKNGQDNIEIEDAVNVYERIMNRPLFYDVPSDRVDVDELINKCPKVYRNDLSSECFEFLTETFSLDPIWSISRFEYHTPIRVNVRFSILNERAANVSFGYGDFDEEVPTWRDIFDGQIGQRSNTIARLYRDQACKDLGDTNSGIHTELTEYCEAREFFKYATFLDVCVTNVARYTELSEPASHIDRNGLNVHEYSLESIRNRIKVSEEIQAEFNKQVRLNLAVAWVAKMCVGKPKLVLVDDNMNEGNDSKGIVTSKQKQEILKKSHDIALRISAKAGDRWAILSYYPRHEDSAYLDDLYEINALLVHRFYASNLGYGVLTNEERLLHGTKAYLILKQVYPEIDSYYDLGIGDQEIRDYVLDKKHIPFPDESALIITPGSK